MQTNALLFNIAMQYKPYELSANYEMMKFDQSWRATKVYSVKTISANHSITVSDIINRVVKKK